MRTERASISAQFSDELKVLRKQIGQLKHIVDTQNITVKRLREELADVTQDRSNILLCWAELDQVPKEVIRKNNENDNDIDI
tara:strand:+ start:807 stop:1052 length:246 start_codon:yes stop_codon:yes gene_type:complete